MNQDSVHILSKIENTKNLKILKKINIQLTKSQKDLIFSFYKNIHNCELKWENVRNDIYNSVTETPKNIFESFLNSHKSIPLSIREKINFKKNISYELIFPNRMFTIYLSFPNSCSLEKALDAIHRIYLLICFINDYARIKCSNTCNIFIYFTDNKKKLPSNKTVIKPLQANTAFTTSCSSHTDILIFREEEWFKVLIHEFFHNLGLDFSGENTNSIQKEEQYIKNLFNLNLHELRAYEAYCETWAELLNVVFFVFHNHKICGIQLQKHRILNDFIKFINYERYFSLRQCIKILKHNGLNYLDLQTDKALLFKENTSTFSYYILKCILMIHLEQFLGFCESKNKYNILCFHNTNSSIKDFFELFDNWNSSKMLLGITIMNETFGKSNSTYDTTLRMSFLQYL